MTWRPNTSSSWSTIATLLLSDGSATGDMPYPGYFFANDNSLISGSQISNQALNYQLSGNSWCLPGSSGINLLNSQFDFQAWTGNYSTYAAAVAGHAYACDTGAFFAPKSSDDPYSGGGAIFSQKGGGSPLTNGLFIDVPAMILQVQPTPEPSTLALAAAGLLGLLAYAWRKRK